MSARSLLITSRRLGASLAHYVREVQAARERYRVRFATREERGVNLLREWLSTEQRAQFDAKRYFDVIGCDSGKRYRIHMERPQTSTRLAMMTFPRSVGASCQKAHQSRAT
jgi:hypothetical protein